MFTLSCPFSDTLELHILRNQYRRVMVHNLMLILCQST